MTSKLTEEIEEQQRHGREKYGHGPDDLEHDDLHTVAEWKRFIIDHATRAAASTPIEARQHLLKVAALACSAIESMDRTTEPA